MVRGRRVVLATKLSPQTQLGRVRVVVVLIVRCYLVVQACRVLLCARTSGLMVSEAPSSRGFSGARRLICTDAVVLGLGDHARHQAIKRIHGCI